MNVATVVATGVDADGHREILGVDVLAAEDGAGGTTFLRSLLARGLAGVQLVVSDAHGGLTAAIAALPRPRTRDRSAPATTRSGSTTRSADAATSSGSYRTGPG